MPYQFVGSLNDDGPQGGLRLPAIDSRGAQQGAVADRSARRDEDGGAAVKVAARRGVGAGVDARPGGRPGRPVAGGAGDAGTAVGDRALPARHADRRSAQPRLLAAVSAVDRRRHKSRWIQLPAGSRITARDADTWEFPVGTRLWKEFAFDGRRVETRMLWRVTADSWSYAAYVWNEAQTDATLAPADGLAGVVEVAPGKRHSVPSRDGLPRLPRQRRLRCARFHRAAAVDRSRSGGAARGAAACRDDHAADTARRAR